MTTPLPDARPWLSILIPVYNVAPYLRDCIDSIAPQLPAEGVEILLLDDASTDNSLQICEEICAEQGPAFRLIRHQANGGPSAARNTMLDQAQGDYIWCVDADDEVMPGALARLREVVERCSPDLVMCDYRKLREVRRSFVGPEDRLSTDREALVRGVFTSRRMHSWSKIAHRRVWGDDLRYPVGRYFEDMTMSAQLILRVHSFYYVPEPWIRYRVRADSTTGITSRTRGWFDDRRNDDITVTMTGFMDAARAALPGMSGETLYCIGQFWAKEFTKICWRLLSARFGRDRWRDMRAKLRRYRLRMEADAPMPFAQLNRDLLRRGRLGRWAALSLCLWLTQPPSTPLRIEVAVLGLIFLD